DSVDCDDGDLCTDDLCSPDTGCTSQAKACDDGVDCTVDGCHEGSGCASTPDDGACDDGDACTSDVCDPTEGCEYATIDCDDGLHCTLDGCDAGTGLCTHTPVACDDGDPCDGLEICNPINGQCLEGTPVVCEDDDACDGTDACDPTTGQCVAGPPIDCYASTADWDGCDGTRHCHPAGVCQTTGLDELQCPSAPDACEQTGGIDGPQAGKVTTGPTGAFVLRDQMQWEDKGAIADQIAEHWSVQYVTLESIVATDMNREGSGISLDGIDCFQGGFWWNDGDNEVDYWWPQGVTGSADAWGSSADVGAVGGSPLLVVSWYHKAEEDSSTSTYKGVRLAIMDLSTYRYRLVLLAEPVCDGEFINGACNGTPDYVPLASNSSSLHAGGIVWYQDLLYMADTSHGFRVFDMSRIQRVQTGDSNTLGFKASADAYHAYNYRYVVPQVGRYQHCGDACCARFSWASLDPTTSPPSILAGEYVSGDITGRAHRWPLDTATGRLLT
ncbi:MAG: hypothetical protein QF464_17355, partial [Myxococcota bacterium]|nr:hypothetical protein [Myxococcota bacterium]